MLDGFSMPVICAANHGECAKWFVHLKCLMNHPILKEDEKLLWLWLATCSANNQSISCSLSIEQISRMISKPEKVVHRCLLRLKIMGLLIGDIPIWYGVPTPEMVKEVRKIKLVLIKREFQEADACVLPRRVVQHVRPKLRVEVYKPYLRQVKPSLRWVRGVVNFVKENHDIRVMWRRMMVN